MNNSRRIGIIDIGSNSIRLVIYEQRSGGGRRVISEFKESARLSGRIGPDGALTSEGMDTLIRIMSRFRRICEAHRVAAFRAAATAAVRNAANASAIIETVRRETGFDVELLSGEDEARIGFLGMIHTMDIRDGLLVDIGGGSTEVSVFRDRRLLRSVSFPFGAVNTAKAYASDGDFTEEAQRAIRQMAERAFASEPWISGAPGLPLVVLGGSLRTLCKIHQRKVQYSLPLTHNYTISGEAMDELVTWLSSMPADKRKKVDGLSKDRHDIIVPGMLILHALYQAARASHYVVSGAGLRDGLYIESFAPGGQPDSDIAVRCADNLLALHSTAPAAHSAQVSRLSVALFDALRGGGAHQYDDRARLCLHIAAKLYRIGASISYYQFARHSFYMIAHARIDGLSHREIVLTALIASYKNRARTQQLAAQHKDILRDGDIDTVVRLGTLLQLGIALDISETQPLELAGASADEHTLRLRFRKNSDPSAEYEEVEALRKEFKKWWGRQLSLHEPSFSTT